MTSQSLKRRVIWVDCRLVCVQSRTSLVLFMVFILYLLTVLSLFWCSILLWTDMKDVYLLVYMVKISDWCSDILSLWTNCEQHTSSLTYIPQEIIIKSLSVNILWLLSVFCICIQRWIWGMWHIELGFVYHVTSFPVPTPCYSPKNFNFKFSLYQLCYISEHTIPCWLLCVHNTSLHLIKSVKLC